MVKIVIFLICSMLLYCVGNNRPNDTKVLSNISKDSSFYIQDIYQKANREPIKPVQQIAPKKVKVVRGKDCDFNLFELDSSIGLYAYSVIGFFQNPQISQRDFIQFNNEKYMIDSLYWLGKIPNDNAFSTYFVSVYKFEFDKKLYYALFAEDSRVSTTSPNYIVILIEYVDSFHLYFRLTDYQACDNLNCFGDFNQDGFLDYLKWGNGWQFNDTMSMFTLKENNFKKDSTYFIKVGFGDNIGKYQIDFRNSKWKW